MEPEPTFPERCIVDCSLLSPSDVRAPLTALHEAKDVKAFPHIPEGVIERRGGAFNQVPALMQVALFLGPTLTYMGKKSIDLAADLVKAYFLKKLDRCEHRKVSIHGPYGDVVSVVECDLKHKGNR